MRMHFRTLTRPRHLAERLAVVFPALSHMQAQEWASQMLGYRNWHELYRSVSLTVEETPYRVISPESLISGRSSEEDLAFFKLVWEHRDVLERLVGEAMPGIETLFFHVDPNFPDVRFRKLGKTGKGSPCFRGFAYDLFEFDGEIPGAGGGLRHDGQMMGDNFDIYQGVPVDHGEVGMISHLSQRMRRSNLPFRGYDADLREALRGNHFGITQLNVEPYDDPSADLEVFLACQTRSYRFFVLENDLPIGAAVLQIDASASSRADDISVEITVEEAWASLDTQAVLDALAMSMAMAAAEPIRRLLWFRVGNPAVRIEVDILSESESPLTWALVNELEDLVPDCVFGIDSEKLSEALLASIRFRGTIAP